MTPPGARDLFVRVNGRRLHLLDWGSDGGTTILCVPAHSVGGATSAICAARYPQLVRGMVLVDPVILPEPYYAHPEASESSDFYGTSRRRRAWPSREAMRESLQSKIPYVRWQPSIFDLFRPGGGREPG